MSNSGVLERFHPLYICSRRKEGCKCAGAIEGGVYYLFIYCFIFHRHFLMMVVVRQVHSCDSDGDCVSLVVVDKKLRYRLVVVMRTVSALEVNATGSGSLKLRQPTFIFRNWAYRLTFRTLVVKSAVVIARKIGTGDRSHRGKIAICVSIRSLAVRGKFFTGVDPNEGDAPTYF